MSAVKGSSNKRKIFAVLEILSKYSDESHPINSQDILSLLERDYNIAAERKSVYNDINLLRECGIDIERVEAKKDGYYLLSRRFETAEIRLLTDAVLSARFITPRKTAELTEKLSQELSVNQAKSIKRQVYCDNRIKFNNEQIYYVIDTVNSAIEQGKKIYFVYYHKRIKYSKVVNDVGKHFIISPYALFWDNDKYYVAGNYEKYDNISNYRLDKMENVQIYDERSRPFTEVCEYKNFFDTADYVNKSFKMYCGDEDLLELICDNSLMEVMFDRFGNRVKYKNQGDGKFRICAKVYISQGLEDWILPYCDKCYIKSPDILRQNVIAKARAAADYLTEINTSEEA